MRNILAEIRESVAFNNERRNCSIAHLRSTAKSARKPHAFIDIFRNATKLKQPCIIAEIKYHSPSQGALHGDSLPASIAGEYLANGAAAISVLTEPSYFKGSVQYLSDVRAAFPQAHLLMKDFIISESQLLEARIHGADAVLLILSLLNQHEFHQLYYNALDLGLTPLVEVHSSDELGLAEKMGVKLIGINNRNLSSLVVDVTTSQKLISQATSDAYFISESGIHTAAQIKLLSDSGFDGFLIGSHFMKTIHPGTTLNNLLMDVSHED